MAIVAIAPINHHRSSIRVFTTRMRLTADKYCDGESDVNMLHLKARFVITNISERAAILYVSPTVSRILVSNDESAFRAGLYEVDMSPFTMTSQPAPSLSEKVFIDVKPHGSYSHDYPGVLPIPVSAEGSAKPGMIGAGSHVISVVLETWPFDTAQLSLWTSRLSKRGPLFSDVLVTVATAFEVARNPTVSKCD
ncbi:MAG TPA: hypothetical protein VH458_01560 [Vicinamibacterales bacterium]